MKNRLAGDLAVAGLAMLGAGDQPACAGSQATFGSSSPDS